MWVLGRERKVKSKKWILNFYEELREKKDVIELETNH
jgi:hypothetical protein